MRLQKQQFRHEPEKGIYGDCLRTALACLLGFTAIEVPHFNDRSDGRNDDDVTRMYNDWLRNRELACISTYYSGSESIESVLDSANMHSFGLPYLLSGTSRTGVDHVVICQKDQIIWDPSITDAGIIGPLKNGLWLVEFIVKPLESYKYVSAT